MNILTTTIDEKRSHITRRAQTQGARTKHNADPMNEKGLLAFARNPICGAKETRTPDPLLAKQMRYQLRHSPIGENEQDVQFRGPGRT